MIPWPRRRAFCSRSSSPTLVPVPGSARADPAGKTVTAAPAYGGAVQKRVVEKNRSRARSRTPRNETSPGAMKRSRYRRPAVPEREVPVGVHGRGGRQVREPDLEAGDGRDRRGHLERHGRALAERAPPAAPLDGEAVGGARRPREKEGGPRAEERGEAGGRAGRGRGVEEEPARPEHGRDGGRAPRPRRRPHRIRPPRPSRGGRRSPGRPRPGRSRPRAPGPAGARGPGGPWS